MSWPKTSTRPSSRVSSPQMRRMSVDLPEPLAPRTPWMSPRSRRIDTCEIAVTGVFLRPTTNRLLTSSIRRAGGPSGRLGAGWTAGRHRPPASPSTAGPVDQRSRSSVVGRGWWSLGAPGKVRGGGWSGTTKAASSASRSVSGGPRGSWSPPDLPGAGEGIKKAGGPIWPTALVRPEGGPAACGLARDGRRSPDSNGAVRRNASGEEERIRHHSSRLL